MEPKNNLQKNIGIFLSIVVILGVLFVTFFLGKQSSINQNPIDNSNTVLNGANGENPASTPTSKKTITPKPTITYRNSEGGDDEGGGSFVPVNTTPTPAPKPVVTTPPPIDIPKKTTLVYKNGTYTVTTSYMSPGGYDELGVSVTLQNDVITSAAVTNMAGDGRSQRYQDSFISGYQPYVIGKNIAGLSLSRVSGASLTTRSFNDALTQIRSQAKA